MLNRLEFMRRNDWTFISIIFKSGSLDSYGQGGRRHGQVISDSQIRSRREIMGWKVRVLIPLSPSVSH